MQNLNQIQCLTNLLQAAENILFSFKVSSEIVQKYETLRKRTFEKCGIPYIPIQIGVKVEEKLERKLETENKSIQTEEIVEADTLTPYLNVNLSILASVSEKASKLYSSVSRLANKPLDPITSLNSSEPSSMCSETLKSQLSNQILTVDSTLLTTLHQVEHLATIFESLRQALYNQDQSFKMYSENFQKELNSQELHFRDQIDSLNSQLSIEKKKFNTQQESLENIIDLQEKEIEIQGQEIQDLQEFIEQKLHESDTIKKVLQDEVMLANEQRLKMLDEAEADYEEKLKKILEDKNIVDNKILMIENTLIEERQQFKKISENREIQFFKHLDGLNGEIKCLNEKIKVLENENVGLVDEKRKVFWELSKIFQFFNGVGLKIKDGEESQAIFENLGMMKKLVEKLTVENNWLVDRLKYYEESNKTLRNSLNQTVNSEVSKDIGKSSTVFTDFERSRVNFKQFLGNRTL